MSGRAELIGDARSRLRLAHEWLRNWGRLTEEERKDEVVSDQDIVELTLAHINIHGPDDGAHSLGSWRPREVSFRVGRAVTRKLIDHGRLQDVEALASAAAITSVWYSRSPSNSGKFSRHLLSKLRVAPSDLLPASALN